MARIARVVVPFCPHHVTNRGNRRQTVFFSDNDRNIYLELLQKYASFFGLVFWAYCLMPNHVHLIAVPLNKESMNLTIREAHKKFTWHVNLCNNWRGTLWQGRFYSFPLDQDHLYRAIRYVENNPVRAGFVRFAEDYFWSSAPSHVLGIPNPLLSSCPVQKSGKAWAAYLREAEEEEKIKEIRRHIMTGRPLGGEEFIDELENICGRKLRQQKAGRKKASDRNEGMSNLSPN